MRRPICSVLVILGTITLSVPVFAEGKGGKCPVGYRQSLSGCLSGSARVTLRMTQPDRTTAVAASSASHIPVADITLDRGPVKPLEKVRRLLLISELAGLESLLASTPRRAPDRANVIRRLAEGYAELEALAELESLEESRCAEQAQRER